MHFLTKKIPRKNSSTNYSVKAYFRIARVYEKIGKRAEAEKTYQKIINLGVKEAKIAEARLEELDGKC